MKKRVADVIFDCLVEKGIKDCFAVVGGGAMHLNNALAIHPTMKTIFNHHEQACAMAAEAYARLSGNMAAVCVTSGPGATNALTGVMGAWVDSVPMIVVSGNVRYETSVEYSGYPLRYRGLQEFDIINSIHNMTKYACQLVEPADVVYEIEKACFIAMEGRRGPVWIDVPLDMQNELVDVDMLRHFMPDEKKIEKVDYDAIIKCVQHAKRPCILLGTAIQTTHCEELVETLVEELRIPIVGGAWCGDIFYSEHPLYYGLSGNAGARPGNFILQNADYILVLGNSLSYKQTGYDISSFAPKANICMVDIDQHEAQKHGDKINQFVLCDVRDFLLALSEKLKENDVVISAPNIWLDYCNRVYNHFPAWEGEMTAKPNSRVNKYVFWKTMLDMMPEETLFALGNSSIGMAANQIGRKKKMQRMISNYICGSMGYDLPAAIGMAVSAKTQIFCVTGDGSIMMNLQELQTIIHNDLKVKIVIMENEGYGAIRQTCKNFFEGKEFGCSPSTGVSCPSFEKVAVAFGYQYNCCYTNEELRDKIAWLIQAKGVAILEVKQQLDDPVLPKLMSRLDENGKMTSPKLHDMYPFVSEKEMEWLMLE